MLKQFVTDAAACRGTAGSLFVRAVQFCSAAVLQLDRLRMHPSRHSRSPLTLTCSIALHIPRPKVPAIPLQL